MTFSTLPKFLPSWCKRPRGAAGSFQLGDSLDEQFFLVFSEVSLREVTSEALLMESSVFARVAHCRRFEITQIKVMH